MAYAYGYLSELYAFKDHDFDALHLAQKAIFYAQTTHSPEALYQWQWQVAKLLKKLNKVKEAIRAYSTALQSLGTVRHDFSLSFGNRPDHRSFFESASTLYFEFADLLLRYSETLTDPQSAKVYLLKAREVIEQLRSAEIEDYLGDECVNIASSKRKTIETITDHTAIVYMIPLKDRLELLISISGKIHQFKAQIGKATLFTEVTRFREQLEQRPIHRYLTSAQKIYSWIIEPIEDLLRSRGITTLIFIPDGALRMIPMAALHNGKEFLIKKFAIAVSPGLTLIQPTPLAHQEMEVITSGISEAVQGFPSLTHVSQEVETIQDILGGELLLNKDFLLENITKNVMEHQYTVVHIASHGRFHSDPKETFVLTYDDRLTLNRLEKILRSGQFRGKPIELLTLSACETAAGDDRSALGLAGVAMKSGARSVLATLWNIDDQASSNLIAEFYQQLKNNPFASKAKALQQAQLTLLKDIRYEHPCYWSPFLIIGNWL